MDTYVKYSPESFDSTTLAISIVIKCSDILFAESTALTPTIYVLSRPLSSGDSKSGAVKKLRAPVEASIANFEKSFPPFKYQVTVSFALNV